jgi:hypothetical protein
MDRRNLLKMGLMTTAGLALFLPKVSFAQEAAQEEVQLTSVIGTNHGHELVMSPVEALKLLRQTRANGPVTLDIKGQSGHPHALVLTHDDLLALFDIGQVAKESTKVAGHTHVVTIRLTVVEIPPDQTPEGN